MLLVAPSQALEPCCLGSNPVPTTCPLCDSGQGTSLCCASVCSSVRWGQESTHITGLLGGFKEVMFSLGMEEALCKCWPFCQKANKVGGHTGTQCQERALGVTFKPRRDEKEEQRKSDPGRDSSKDKGPRAAHVEGQHEGQCSNIIKHHHAKGGSACSRQRGNILSLTGTLM